MDVDLQARPDRAPAARAVGLTRLKTAVTPYVGVGTGLVLVCLYLGLTQPAFGTTANWENILRSQAVIMILAAGMTFVVLTGGIDLAIASAMAFGSVLFGILLLDGWPWYLAALGTVAFSSALGALNGFMISVLKIPFFVVTLGTLSVYSSLALVVSDGQTQPLYTVDSFQPVSDIVNGSVGPVPTLIVLVALLYVVFALLLKYTWFGRGVYATGSNIEAARLAGINVRRTLLAVYTVAGLTAGLAALVSSGRLTAASPQVDPNLMLTVVAAVLIGGASFTGGEGGMFGTALGTIFLAVVQNALTLSDVSTFWQGTVSGAILIVAVGIGVVRRPDWRLAVTSRLFGRGRGQAG